jgi:hypothetical protein
MKALSWPTLDPDHQWLTAALEKDMLESNQTPEELRAEAERVRGEVPTGTQISTRAFSSMQPTSSW